MPEDKTKEALIQQNRKITYDYLKTKEFDLPEFDDYNKMLEKGYLDPNIIYDLYEKDEANVGERESFIKNLGFDYDPKRYKEAQIEERPYKEKEESEKNEYDNYLERADQINDLQLEYNDTLYNKVRNDTETKLQALKENLQEKYKEKIARDMSSPAMQDPIYRENYQHLLDADMKNEYNMKVSDLVEKNTDYYNKSYAANLSQLYKPEILDVKDIESSKNEVFESDDFFSANYSDKTDLLRKSWLVFAKEKMDKGELNPEEYYQAKKEYMHYMLTPLFESQDAKANTFAIKGYMESILPSIEEEVKQMKDLWQENKVGNLVYTGDLENYHDDFVKLNTLDQARRNIKEALRINESEDTKFKDIGKGLTSQNWYGYLPFASGGIDLADNISSLKLISKAVSGEQLNPEEKKLFTAISMTHELEENAPENFLYSTGKIIGEAVPYIGEFALTRGIFTEVRTGIKSALDVSIKAMAKKSFKTSLAKGASKFLSYNIAALAQTAANPQAYTNNILERMTPEVMFMLSEDGRPIVNLIDQQSAESFPNAFLKGFGMSYAEFFTENLGTSFKPFGRKLMLGKKQLIRKGSPKLYKALNNFSKKNTEWFKATTIAKHLGEKGVKVATPGEAYRYFLNNKLGWSGFFEEWGEEFINTRMSDFITGDYEGGRLKSLVQFDPYNEGLTASSILLMSAGFGIPGKAKVAYNKNVKDNYIRFFYKDIKGKEKKIIFPKKYLKEIEKEFEKEKVPDIPKLKRRINNSNLNTKQKAALSYILSDKQVGKINDLLKEKVDKKKVEIAKEEPQIETSKLSLKGTDFEGMKIEEEGKKEKKVSEEKKEIAEKEKPKKETLTGLNELLKNVQNSIDDLESRINQGEDITDSEMKDLEKQKEEIQKKIDTKRKENIKKQESKIGNAIESDKRTKNEKKQIYDYAAKAEKGTVKLNDKEYSITKDDKNRITVKGKEKSITIKKIGSEYIESKPGRKGTKKEKKAKGITIYGTPTTGKTYAVKELGEGYIDADEILKDILIEEGLDNEAKDFKNEWQYVAANHPELKKMFHERIKALNDKGINVFTGNNWGREIADKAILSKDINRIAKELVKRKGISEVKAVMQAQKIIKREAEELKGIETEELGKEEYFIDKLRKEEEAIKEEPEITSSSTEAEKEVVKEAKKPKEEVKKSTRKVLKKKLSPEEVNQKYEEGKKKIVNGLSGLSKLAVNKKSFVAEDLEFKKLVKETLSGLADVIDVSIQRFIELIRESIRLHKDLTKEQKERFEKILDSNIETIENYALQIRAFQNTEYDFDLELPDGIAFSSEKNNNFRKTFSEFFKDVNNSLNVGRDEIEYEILDIAKSEDLQKVINEHTYKIFIQDLSKIEGLKGKIAKYFKGIQYPEAVSLFNYYRNAKLYKQIAMTIQGSKLEEISLNSFQEMEKLLNDFNNKIKTLGDTDIKELNNDHIKRRNKRFKKRIYKDREGSLDESGEGRFAYYQLSDNGRYNVKKQQHKNDLKFLENLTGISSDIWKDYFNSKTKETIAYNKKYDKEIEGKEIDYENYDDLLKNDVYKKARSGYYEWIQSKLVSTINYELEQLNKNVRIIDNSYRNKVISYFTEPKIENNRKVVFSNLAKLESSKKSKNEVALSGLDVKRNRFSSFVLSTNIGLIADEILSNNNDSNPIVKYYKERNIPMELNILNGIINFDKKDTERIPALNITKNDMILSFIYLYSASPDSYKQTIGQLGDKKHIILTTVPKIKNKDFDKFKKEYKEYNEAYKEIQKSVNINVGLLKGAGIIKSRTAQGLAEEKDNLIKNFLYDFAYNAKAMAELFYGNQSSYEANGKFSLVDMVKRAASSYSQGYRVDENIEGGLGKEYSHAVVNDMQIETEDGNVIDAFDGIEFFTEGWADKMQVSMGSIYSKSNIFPRLSSVKALHSSVTDGKRGLTKGNMVNIDMLAESMGENSVFAQIRDMMYDNNIETLSFDSTTKKNESGERTEIFDLLKEKPEILIRNIKSFKRKTKDLFVQQDLRHEYSPKPTRMPSQLLSNILYFSDSPKITEMIGIMIDKSINSLNKEYTEANEEERIEWIKTIVNEFSQPELYKLIEDGITMYEPSYMNMLRQIISTYIEKNGLNIPINRVTTQEIPVANMNLLGLRNSEKKGKILLPQMNVNIEGIRYDEDNEFDSKEKALKVYKLGIKQGLFDDIEQWEIFEQDGKWYIPGEIVISTRVPADNLHSHTVGRAHKRIPNTNFTMLDLESWHRSGSDFDGDQRFNQVAYRKDNKMTLDNSQEGLANKIMMSIVDNYRDEKNYKQITEPINTKKYDDYLKKEIDNYDVNSFLGYIDLRSRNMVGVKLKGILTDHSTIFSYLSKNGVTLKNKIKYKDLSLSGFVKDEFNLVKNHLGIILNLAFDNAKDQKIERLGINETTTGIAISLITLNKEIDDVKNYKDQDKFITEYIGRVANYLNSDIVKRFRSLEQERKSKVEKGSIMNTFNTLENQFSKDKVDFLKKIHFISTDVTKIKTLHSLLQSAPKTFLETIEARKIFKQISTNSLVNINTKGLFGKSSNTPVSNRIESVINISENTIFNDTFEKTKTTDKILSYISEVVDTKLSNTDVKGIIYSLNTIAAIKALDKPEYSFKTIENELVRIVGNAKHEDSIYSENAFIQSLQVIYEDDTKYVSFNNDLKTTNLSDNAKEKIRDGFDKLDNELKDKIVYYQLSKYGISNSTFHGGYYPLISNNYKIDLSKKMKSEHNRWLDALYDQEIFDMAEWIMRNSKNPLIRKHALQEYTENVLDLNTQPTISKPIVRDGIEDENDSIDSGLSDVMEEEGIDPDSFNALVAEAIENEGLNEKPKKGISKEVKDRIQHLSGINYSFDYDSVKYMLGGSTQGELLLTEDKELSNYIYSTLQKNYPSVDIFKSKEKFIEFVQKNFNRGFNINQEAIGASINNAVFIDPTKAIQSTIIHEFAHIYWDAIGADPIKSKLKSLFDNEEETITAIGIAGTDMMKLRLKSSKLNRFLDYLRQFWRKVKRVLGFAKKKDLLNEMAYNIVTNKAGITPQTNQGKDIVKYVINNNPDGFQEKKESWNKVAGKNYPGVTSIINKLQGDPFDAEKIISKKLDFMKAELEGRKTEAKKMEEILNKEEQKLRKHYDTAAEVGSKLDEFFEVAFEGKEKVPEQLRESVSSYMNSKVIDNIFEDTKKMKETLEKKHPGAQFIIQEKGLSDEYQISYVPDIYVIEKDGIYVYDNKSTSEALFDDEGNALPAFTKSFGLMQFPLVTALQNRETKHTMQTAMYGQLLSMKLNLPIKGIGLIPMTVSYGDNFNVKSIDFPKEPIMLKYDHRIKTQALQVLSHANNFNKSIKWLDDFISELRDQGYDMIILDKFEKAIKTLTLTTGKQLENITHEDIAFIRNKGLSSLIGNLSNLGYDKRKIALSSFERLFYSSIFDIDDKEIDGQFEEVEIGEYHVRDFTRKLKGKEVLSDKINGKEVLFKPIYSFDDIGDDIIIIDTVKSEDGTFYELPKKAEVIYLNKKEAYIRARTSEGDSVTLDLKDNNVFSDWTSIYTDKHKDNLKKVSISDISKVELKKETSYHYKIDEDKRNSLTPEEDKRYISGMKVLWSFFDEFDRLHKVSSLFEDKHRLIEWYEKISTIQGNELSSHLSDLLMNVIINHEFAEGLREESKYKTKGIRPLTIEIYDMITGENTDLWSGQMNLKIPSLATPFMVKDENGPLRYMTSVVSQAWGEYEKDYASIHYLFKEYGNIIKEKNLIEDDGYRPYFKDYRNAKDSNERNVLKIIRDLFEKIQPDIGKIYVPETFITKTEFNTKYGYGLRTYDKLKPDSSIDFVKLRFTDNEGNESIKSLREIKDSIITSSNMSDETIKKWFGHRLTHPISKLPFIRNKISLGKLDDYIHEARTIIEKGGDKNNPNIKKTIRSLRISNWGQVSLKTDFILASTEKYLKAQLFKHHMKKSIPIYDYLKYKYEENTGTETQVYNWIEKYVDAVVYKRTSGKIDSPELNYAARQLTNIFSLSKLGAAIRPQVFNYSIGKVNNFVYHPEAFLKGQRRSNPMFNRKGHRKALNLLNHLGFINIAEVSLFDAKETDFNKFASKYGYGLMEWVEKRIQKDLLAGLMTEKEWNAFNDNGEIINIKDAPSPERLQQIKDTIMNIHGAYSVVASSPWTFTSLGRSVLQFQKYRVSLFHKWYAGYYRDRNYEIKSGIIQSLLSLSKFIKYNTLSKDNRAKAYEEALKKMKEKKEINDYDLKTIGNYASLIISESEGERISFKDLTSNDKRNLRSVLLMGMMYGLTRLAIELIGGDDDETLHRKYVFTEYIIKPYIQRLKQDIFFMTEEVDVKVASTGIFAETLKLLTSIISGQRSQKDTKYADAGAPLYFYYLLNTVPFGGAVKEAFMYEKFFERLGKGELQDEVHASQYQLFKQAIKKSSYSEDEKIYELLRILELSYNAYKHENKKKIDALLFESQVKDKLKDPEIREIYKRGIDRINKEKKIKGKRRAKSSEDFERLIKEIESEDQ